MNSTGKLRYSPTLNNGSKDRRDGGTTKWWLILDVDPELGRYLRHMYHLHTHKTDSLQRPLWGAHISVIRDEPPPQKNLWEKHRGLDVDFEYDASEFKSNDIYVWIPVVCEAALDIRVELGLNRQPPFNLHMTIGNRKP